jgi:hypothetical protein
MNHIPFHPKEMNSSAFYPSPMSGMAGARIYNTPVPPKENYLALFRRETPHWIPSGSDRRGFAPRIDPDNIARVQVLETQQLKPEERTGGKDKHGVEWVYVPVAGGSMVKPGNPLLADANDWEERVPFPDLDSWDWAGSIAANQADLEQESRALTATIVTGFFERLISLMDFNNAAIAMIDSEQKDAVKALFGRLADLYIDMAKRFKEAYNPMILCVHDDWGSQKAPFFSLATIREMLVPAISRVVQAAHGAGMYFDMHSCGKNELIVPAYLEIGADYWSGQSINDRAMLYEKYGGKLIFGLDPDVPFSAMATDEEASAAAKRFVLKYGPTIEKKPFVCATINAPQAFLDTLYEESRKMLS